MGSAITFSDKITNKNCQNLQDLKESCATATATTITTRATHSRYNSSCNSCNHNHCISDHVDINYQRQDHDHHQSDQDQHHHCQEESETLLLQQHEQKIQNQHESQGPISYHWCYQSHNHQQTQQQKQEHEDGQEDSLEYEFDEEDHEEFSKEDNGEGEEEGHTRVKVEGKVVGPPPPRAEADLLLPRGKVETVWTRLWKYMMGGRRCLCDTIKPILKLSQLLGVIPLRLNHQKNSKGETTGSCEFTFRWTSLSTILNTCLILFFILITPIAHAEIRDRMSSVFSGTDLYAFTLQTMAMVLETTILLTVGRLYKGKFSRGWSSLNEVFHAICDSADDLKQIKLGSYITALIIMLEGVGFFVFMYWTSHRAIGLYQSCSALLIGTFVISLTLIIPYIMSTLFLFICLLIRSHFLKISDMLRTVVSKQNSPKLSSKIDSLRVLHEQLCQTVTYFEDFFGFQVLLTLCTCCFTVTVGAYACILQGEGMSSPQGKELTGAWGMQLYCAAIFILLILISGQLVTNAAASPGPVLNAIPLTELDEKSQTQVTAFLNKISAFPTKMSAVKITTISTTFLASAATNITTYLLVLMQFKLSFENRFDDDADNFTTTVPGFDEMDSTEPIFYNVTVPESLAFLTESL